MIAGKITKLIGDYSGSLVDLLWPGICRHCSADIDGADTILCAACWEGLRYSMMHSFCPTCGKNVGQYELQNDCCHRCRGSRAAIKRFARLGRYEMTLRELILQLKYQKNSTIYALFGQLASELLARDDYFDDIDVLVPVPMHWTRRLLRGANQANTLALEIKKQRARQGHKMAINRGLVRIKRTRPLAGLSDTERKKEIRGAFAVRPDVDFAGKHICLIDDICTSGITLQQSALVVKKAGAGKISAMVLAMAGND